jgi:hypothetical protein
LPSQTYEALDGRQDTLPPDRWSEGPAQTREVALGQRVEAKDPDDEALCNFNPARGLELGPCRGSRCKHRPRVKLRDLYARAESVAASGGESVYV